MSLTGRTEFMLGRKLYERSDGLYQDDRGRLFDIRYGKLYERRSGYGKNEWPTWHAIRPRPAATADHDAILNQVEGF